jgi:hypothetical protein
MAKIPEQIEKLVATFGRNREQYKSGAYNETEVRVEFINPFWKALGWDMDNEAGYAMAYRDVIHEDAIKVGGATKAPDYCFRIGGARKFFLEAKKPAVNLKDDASPAYQLRRYAWSCKLPLSVLTDFEELAVYDCTSRPKPGDKASSGRVKYLQYTDYLDQWDAIAEIFHRESVLKGSFDKFADSTKSKKGTGAVDSEFLLEIEGWREALAKNIALRNPALSVKQLNFAVQKTIDRIVFLRMCEDKSIEPYGQLQALVNGAKIYPRLLKIFRDADDKYNSGLFHFTKEKDREGAPDELTPRLDIDDKILKDVIQRLYYPECPYEFSILPPEILGNVYEQFLGKVIRLTAGHQAKVEEKPEVRKAGGVYYTPDYIVNYIVENTVGKLCEGKTPKDVAELKILDPACGSGSFLLGAYRYLLDWHLQYYLAEKDRTGQIPLAPVSKGRKKQAAPEAVFENHRGEWLLTTAEKKRILLNNIHGVDIDAQAVEVSKLSLLLKVLEQENQSTVAHQLSFWRERVLPDLSDNIRCGNSLIGPDYYDGQEQGLLFVDEETRDRINVFDWHDEKYGFGQIMKTGGFDAVIGNPPYIFTRNQGIAEKDKIYFYQNYNYQSPQLNTFGLFLEHCYFLIKTMGMVGFITPNNWLTIDSFSSLRKFLVTAENSLFCINIMDKVFQKADVDTAIIILEKNGSPEVIKLAEMKSKELSFLKEVARSYIAPPAYIIQIGLLKDKQSIKVIGHIEENGKPLSNFCTVSTGLKVYQTGKGKPPQTNHEKSNRVFHSKTKIFDTSEPYLDGVDVARYNLGWSGEYLNYGDWIAEPRRSVPFSGKRLLIRQIPGKRPYLVHGVYATKTAYNDINSMVVFSPIYNLSLKYLLSLINSRLLSFWFEKTFDKLQRKIFPQFKVKELKLFPIRPIDFAKKEDVQMHDQMVGLVETMLELNQRLHAPGAALDPDQRRRLEQDIAHTDRQIDRLVYQLYRLTDEEIKIVEGE